MTEIRITANRSDTEPSRIERLKKLSSALESKGIKSIAGLHDHKGVLYVNWSEVPTSTEIGEAIGAWNAEGEPLSNHAVNGRPLVWDVKGDNPFGGQLFA
jgi:hypothetical protein